MDSLDSFPTEPARAAARAEVGGRPGLSERLVGPSLALRSRFRATYARLGVGLAGLVLLLALGLTPTPALAATITVDGAGCTLAQAITTANDGTAQGSCTQGDPTGPDTIDLTVDVGLTVLLPKITSAITLEGNGHTIGCTSCTFRILNVSAAGNLTLNSATLSGGGGGIYNSGTVTVQNSTITGSVATQVGGGAIGNVGGTVTVRNSTLSGNRGSSGGAILQASGVLTVENSTLSGNTANTGGGIFARGTVTILNSTISGNSGSSGSGGVFIVSGTVTVQNSIIALQTAGNDCAGTLISQGYNIEGGTSCGFTGTGDQQNVTGDNLNLGALADNGGPTWTHALATGSVALEQIPKETNGCGIEIAADQRGAPRAGGTGKGGDACDVGAYEYDSSVPTAVTLRTLAASPGAAGGWAGLAAALTVALAAGWRVLQRNRTG